MRIVGLLGIVVALAAGAYAFGFSAQSGGRASGTAQNAEQQATAALADATFQTARAQLQDFRATNGTYVGAALPPTMGVTLVRADATSYCVQTTAPTDVQHEVGPDGSRESGPC